MEDEEPEKNISVTVLKGVLSAPERAPVALEEMEEAIVRGAGGGMEPQI